MIISWVTEIHAEKFSLPCNEFYISIICRHPLATLRKFRPLQSALMPTGTMEVFENSEAPV